MSPSYHHIPAACLGKAKRHATGGCPARSGAAGDAPSGLVHLICCYNVRNIAPRRNSVEFTPCNSIRYTVTKVKTSHHGQRELHVAPLQSKHCDARNQTPARQGNWSSHDIKKRDSNQPPLRRKCGKQNRRTPSCCRNTSQSLSKLAVI